MTPPTSTTVSVSVLRHALGATGARADGASERLTRAVEGIGWRGGDSAEAAEVAEALLPSIASCVNEHGDLGTLYREIAEVLRASGPMLDGSLPSVYEYLPAAAELIRGFIALS